MKTQLFFCFEGDDDIGWMLKAFLVVRNQGSKAITKKVFPKFSSFEHAKTAMYNFITSEENAA